ANKTRSENILVVPYEIGLLPDVAEEAVGYLRPKVHRTLRKKIGPRDSHLVLRHPARASRAERVVKRRAVVPLHGVEDLPELLVVDVDVSAPRPVVPEVRQVDFVFVRQVHEHQRVELLRPRQWTRARAR
ncbi:hypothetical protein TorRG33x02_063040, partial [Trema orientale]